MSVEEISMDLTKTWMADRVAISVDDIVEAYKKIHDVVQVSEENRENKKLFLK